MSTAKSFSIGGRIVGPDHPPLVIAEIGINHEGEMDKAIRMIEDAAKAGCEVCKFQSHVIEDEMIPEAKKVIPGNTNVSIWEVMERCALSAENELKLKEKVESLGMTFLSTPFSRAAADRLEAMNVCAYKIGSGECNNYPLVKHVASFGKPIILSTGMNDVESIKPSVEILRAAKVPFCLMQCTSIYPTPYNKVHLGALDVLGEAFPDAVLGLSDHSKGIWTCVGACARGAVVLEKHYVSDKSWPGPDVDVSIDPAELQMLKTASTAVWEASKGKDKCIFPEEQVTIDFAYSCVVTIAPIKAGEEFTMNNIWCKRPGTGQIKAKHFESILGKKATCDLLPDVHVQVKDVDGFTIPSPTNNTTITQEPKNYTVDVSKKWDYENGFFLTCDTGRIGKLMSHLEIYKKIVGLPGHIMEFGVYKGTSLVRLLSFRDMLECSSSRKTVGFDAFGKFPRNLEMDSDKEFVETFELVGGCGISKDELSTHLKSKGMTNWELVEGDILETLPAYLSKNPSIKVSLLHIDVDVYEPSKVILELLWDRLVPGGILMLDDYGTVEGETRAVDEFFKNKNIQIHKVEHYHIPSYIVKPNL